MNAHKTYQGVGRPGDGRAENVDYYCRARMVLLFLALMTFLMGLEILI
jgi:hypothetical protein